MKALIFLDNEEKEYDAIIKRNKNKYSVQISVSTNFPDNIELIRTFDENGNKMTMINCYMISYTSKENGITAIEFRSSYIIDKWINSVDIKIKQLSMHFREIDFMWIKNRFKMDIKKHILAQKKPKYHLLYECKDFKISVQELHGTSSNDSGQTILNFPCKVFFEFNKEIKLPFIFDNIRKIESCFGFMVGHKLNLLSIDIEDTNNEYYEVITPYLKEYSDCKEVNSNVLDLHGRLISNIISHYFEDSHLQVAINNFYEYIYNPLDPVMEFTSLCNTIEVLSNHEKYKFKIINYSSKIFGNRKENNTMFKAILKRAKDNEQQFLKGIYNLNYTSLKDKLMYFFYNDYDLPVNDTSNQFISKIVSTRNFYVHGGKKKIFNYDDITIISYLLRTVLYLSILKICNSRFINSNYVIVTANKDTIQNCYNHFNLLEDSKNV